MPGTWGQVFVSMDSTKFKQRFRDLWQVLVRYTVTVEELSSFPQLFYHSRQVYVGVQLFGRPDGTTNGKHFDFRVWRSGLVSLDEIPTSAIIWAILMGKGSLGWNTCFLINVRNVWYLNHLGIAWVHQKHIYIFAKILYMSGLSTETSHAKLLHKV